MATNQPTQRELFGQVVSHLPGRRRFTEEQESAIVADYQKLRTTYAVATMWDSNPTSISNILRRHGIDRNLPGLRAKQDRVTTEQKRQAVQMYQDGVRMDKIAEFLGRGRAATKIIIRESGVTRRGLDYGKKYTIDDNFFRRPFSEAHAWLLGWLATDGNVSKKAPVIQLRVQAGDADVLEKVNSVLQSTFPVQYHLSSVVQGKRHGVAGIYLRSRTLKDDLAEHGITPNKTHTVKPWAGPEHLMTHYWHGCLEGDGSIFRAAHRQWSVQFAGNEFMVAGFAAFLHNRLGIQATMRLARRRTFTATYHRFGDVPRIISLLYNDATLWLNRKKAIADTILGSRVSAQ